MRKMIYLGVLLLLGMFCLIAPVLAATEENRIVDEISFLAFTKEGMPIKVQSVIVSSFGIQPSQCGSKEFSYSFARKIATEGFIKNALSDIEILHFSDSRTLKNIESDAKNKTNAAVAKCNITIDEVFIRSILVPPQAEETFPQEIVTAHVCPSCDDCSLITTISIIGFTIIAAILAAVMIYKKQKKGKT